jgi:acetylcholinesterase
MQATYDKLVGATSCANLVGSAESLECLRKAPFEEINKALGVSGIGPWPPVLDGDIVADFCTNQLANDKYPKVSLLVGANSDEGSAFGTGWGTNGGGVNTDEEMRRAIQAIIPPNAQETTGKSIQNLVDELMYLYPNIQTRGTPSMKTYPSIIKPGDAVATQLGLQFRRTSALFGD